MLFSVINEITTSEIDNIKKENAICFVYQPEKSRRCDYIGLKALRIVKTLRPDIQIYLYGSNAPASFEFECKNDFFEPA